MSLHPSLSGDVFDLPPLDPTEVMQPYVPCWCRSGKKWKFCHKGRESMKAVPIGRLFNEMRVSTIKSYCSHPLAGPSCGKLIRSHTIQRRGGLSEIAELGHVYSVKEGSARVLENSGVVTPQRIGYRSASTFAGFCGVHDREMFAPIETRVPEQTKQNIFLFSFRAIAYEEFSKSWAHNCVAIQRQADFGTSFLEQTSIQEYLHCYETGLKRGISDIAIWKEEYDDAYRNNDYAKFSGYACTFVGTLPIASCGAFHPEVDFFGNQLQVITRGDAPFEHIAFSLAPVDGVTLLTFGWFGEDDGPAEKFARSFMALVNADKSNAAIHLAFEHLENTYITPTWWDSLNEADRAALTRRSMPGGGPRGPDRGTDSLTNLEPIVSSMLISGEALLL